jgi:hypothetical protein
MYKAVVARIIEPIPAIIPENLIHMLTDFFSSLSKNATTTTIRVTIPQNIPYPIYA